MSYYFFFFVALSHVHVFSAFFDWQQKDFKIMTDTWLIKTTRFTYRIFSKHHSPKMPYSPSQPNNTAPKSQEKLGCKAPMGSSSAAVLHSN